MGTIQRILNLLRPFAPFMRPYVRPYVGAITLQALVALLGLLPPLLIKGAIDRAIHSADKQELSLLLLFTLIIVISSSALNNALEYLHERVSAHFTSDLRTHLFACIQQRGLPFFANTPVGSLLGRLHDDVGAVYAILVNLLLDSLNELLQIIGIFAIVSFINIRLALVAFIFVPFVVAVVWVSGVALKPLSRAVRVKDMELVEFIQERITNMYAIKLFTREGEENANHKAVNASVIKAILKRVRYKFTSLFVISSLASAASIIVLWVGGFDVIGGSLTLGSLFAFYMYTVRLYTPVQSLAGRLIDMSSSVASAELVTELMETPKPHERSATKLWDVAGHIEFRDVSYAYPESESPVLRFASFAVRPGSIVALIGESGAGKTTLLNLMAGFYSIQNGTIRIDGRDINGLSEQLLRSIVGVVPQEPYLFNTSIKENIWVGRAAASEQDVYRAAESVGVDDIISQLPHGYHTVVGSRGVRLSGGQRQRIALARMLLKNPPIWLLDEATSSLDLNSEREVLESVLRWASGRTVLLVTHRPSVVALADETLMLRAGVVQKVSDASPGKLRFDLDPEILHSITPITMPAPLS